MLVIMKPGTTEERIEEARQALLALCAGAQVSVGTSQTVIALFGDEREIDPDHILAMFPHDVQRVVPVQEKYRLAALRPRGEHSVVRIGDVPFGAGHAAVIAGPCAVESYGQLLETITAVQAAGAEVGRGDFTKARTSPYDWRGLGEEALRHWARVKEETGMPFIVDVLNGEDIKMALSYGADCLRIGTRYMYDAELLEAAGQQQEAAVMIKRGFSATLAEWLLAAEYVLAQGNGRVVLCARGIRTHETETRNSSDIQAVPVLRAMTHLPVVVDPSHMMGIKELVAPMAAAAMTLRADGLMVDVHPRPAEALVDGAQALLPAEFAALMQGVRPIAAVQGLRLR